MLKNRFRYYVIVMIVLMSIINYVDRGALSYAQADIIKLWNLDPVSWGKVLGFFGYGYIVGPMLGGILADKKGPKVVWLTTGVLWSILVIGTAFAGEIGLALFGSVLGGYAIVRGLFGAAEGPTYATASRSLQNWAAPKDRGITAAIGLVGVPAGAMVSAPISVALISLLGWRYMFIALGCAGIIWVIIWSKTFTNLPEDNKYVTEEELAIIRSDKDMIEGEKTIFDKSDLKWYDFFKNPTYLFNTIGYMGFMYINFVLLTWTPKYLQDVYHFKLTSLWYLGMIPWIGAVITVLLGGKISDRLKVKTGNLRIARGGLAVFSYFFCFLCFIAIPKVHSYQAVLFLMMIGNAFNYLPNSVHWSVVVDIDPANAGTFGGLTHGFTNISSIVGPTLTGILVARTGGYDAMFIAAACAAAISCFVMFFVNPAKEKFAIYSNSEKLTN